MANLYKQFQKALTSYEDRPMAIITKQNIDESLYIIRGKDHGRPAWHYILVSVSSSVDLKAQKPGATIDITEFGRIIEYRDRQNNISSSSGWGRDPPKMFQLWIEEQCEPATINIDISLKYTEDDIRLCTMQRAIPRQKIGVQFFYYNKQERFHYIKLSEELKLSLAIRSGIKSYDRIITFNDVNIENDTEIQFMERFDSQRHLPIQMLVCSPATYLEYSKHGKPLHHNLPTVRRLEPVYASSTTNSDTNIPTICFDEKIFCAIQWENNEKVSVVSQTEVYKSPKFTSINDICFVKIKTHYQRGKIIFIGSYDDCKKLSISPISHIATKVSNVFTRIFPRRIQNSSISATNLHSNSVLQRNKLQKIDKSILQIIGVIQNTNNNTTHHDPIHQSWIEENIVKLEDLSNELFLLIFIYLDIKNLYNAFWGLNTRLNNLFQSHEHLSFTFDDNTDQLSMKSYSLFVTKLIIDTSNQCDLTQFPNLQSLILCNSSIHHLQQLQPDNFPNLKRLSFLLGSKFVPSTQLVNQIFSNGFPLLNHVNLGRIQDFNIFTPSISPSLHFLSIRCGEPLIVSYVLTACPNLDHLQVHIFKEIQDNAFSLPPFNHSLRRFTLWSDSIQLTSTNIDVLLINTPNVQHFYLQTIISTSFIDLTNILIKRLKYLYRFDCYIKEMIEKDRRTIDLSILHRLHWSFYRIEYKENNEDFSILVTK